MNETQLVLLNYFFLIFHTLFILFNLFGWIWRKTRKWNFITLMLTLFSWIILGIWKGFGYCFLTDWHYDVLNKLGETDLPRSYITYLVFEISGWLPNRNLVDMLTIIGITIAVLASVYLNFKKNKYKEVG